MQSRANLVLLLGGPAGGKTSFLQAGLEAKLQKIAQAKAEEIYSTRITGTELYELVRSYGMASAMRQWVMPAFPSAVGNEKIESQKEKDNEIFSFYEYVLRLFRIEAATHKIKSSGERKKKIVMILDDIDVLIASDSQSNDIVFKILTYLIRLEEFAEIAVVISLNLENWMLLELSLIHI